MTVQYYAMRDGQEEQVVQVIHRLIAEYGAKFSSQLTAETLRASSGFLNVEVAERASEIIGICTWVMSFSTWRGVKGIYINDHFVVSKYKKTEVAYNLLHCAAQNGASHGARFVRTEIDISEEDTESVYAEVGFWNQVRHSLYFLEPDHFDKLIAAPQRGAMAT